MLAQGWPSGAAEGARGCGKEEGKFLHRGRAEERRWDEAADVLDHQYTKVKFCQEWAKATLAEVPGTRKNFTAGMQQASSSYDFGNLASPQHAHVQSQVAEHRLIDMRDVAFEKDGHTRHVLKGACAYSECPWHANDDWSLVTFRCNQCDNRCEGKQHRMGAYFHIHCFGECHRCVAK